MLACCEVLDCFVIVIVWNFPFCTVTNCEWIRNDWLPETGGGLNIPARDWLHASCLINKMFYMLLWFLCHIHCLLMTIFEFARKQAMSAMSALAFVCTLIVVQEMVDFAINTVRVPVYLHFWIYTNLYWIFYTPTYFFFDVHCFLMMFSACGQTGGFCICIFERNATAFRASPYVS